MPIQLAPLNKKVRITRITLHDEKTRASLQAMGIAKGVEVVVVRKLKGSVIVLVNGARLALGERTASGILVA